MRPTPLPNPPGQVEALSAERVLVLAPHADDEIVGCGGLLGRLVDEGATVRILILTDGAAGGPKAGVASATEDDLVAIRRSEAAAVAQLFGFAAIEHLGLPDGRLSEAVEVAAAKVAAQLEDLVPDLVLVPSPTEVSADHRAAFAALHRVLSAQPEASFGSLQVLLYEINHPQHPDLLVDVGDRLGAIEAAMALYASQEAQHPYLAAALGLRRWRTLTLAPEIEAAEAYRRLRPNEFRTRGLDAMIRWLGGVGSAPSLASGPAADPSRPLVSVIVRTKDRPELLMEALDSLIASTWRPLEIVVVNDGGQPPDLGALEAACAADAGLHLRRLDLAENLGRAGAANEGVAAATGAYLAFCDDDDRVEPEHFAILVGAAGAAGVRVVYSDAAVGVYRLGQGGWEPAERRLPYSRDFDRDLLLFDNYIPFNTLLIERALLQEMQDQPPEGTEGAGPFDPALPFFEDWDFLLRLAEHVEFHHLAQVTCEYRQFRGAGHHVLGDDPRGRADFLEAKAGVIARHRERLTPDRAARVVDTLRAEAVRAEEAEREVRARIEALQAQFHGLRGSLVAAREHVGQLETLRSSERADTAAREADTAARLDAVTEMRHQLERELAEVRAAGEERSTALAAAYVEIGRLDSLVRAMEATRAWRLHDRLQSLLGRRDGSPS